VKRKGYRASIASFGIRSHHLACGDLGSGWVVRSLEAPVVAGLLHVASGWGDAASDRATDPCVAAGCPV
jgi:hypothetical protein